MNATDAMGEGDRTEGNPSPEDGAADGVRFVRNRADKDSRARFSLGRARSRAHGRESSTLRARSAT